MHRFNSLKQVQYFDARTLIKGKGKNRKNIQLTTFRNTSNITKYFEK